MSAKTDISWAGGAWNPFFGCTKVGPGCDNCYAVLEAHRKTFNSKLPSYLGSGVTHSTPDGVEWTGKVARNSDKVWSLPASTKKPTVFFVNSMSDLFHEDISDADIVAVFEEMYRCPQHIFQVLTKRPNRMVGMSQMNLIRWTPNIWAGVTIENDKMVKRANLLRKVPAHIRFVSAEPLLSGLPNLDLTGLDWLIVGGESGPKARPMDVDWARDLRDRCIGQTMNGDPIVFHFKQWGGWGADGVRRSTKANGHLLDGAEWHDLPDKAVVAEHGSHSVEEFRTVLSEQRLSSNYKTIMIGGSPARIKLRDVVLSTLSSVKSMEAKQLCKHDLIGSRLDPASHEHVNIHAWALSDLVREKRIRRFKTMSSEPNRFGRYKSEWHYELAR